MSKDPIEDARMNVAKAMDEYARSLERSSPIVSAMKLESLIDAKIWLAMLQIPKVEVTGSDDGPMIITGKPDEPTHPHVNPFASVVIQGKRTEMLLTFYFDTEFARNSFLVQLPDKYGIRKGEHYGKVANRHTVADALTAVVQAEEALS